jgi:hypothetical protein
MRLVFQSVKTRATLPAIRMLRSFNSTTVGNQAKPNQTNTRKQKSRRTHTAHHTPPSAATRAQIHTRLDLESQLTPAQTIEQHPSPRLEAGELGNRRASIYPTHSRIPLQGEFPRVSNRVVSVSAGLVQSGGWMDWIELNWIGTSTLGIVARGRFLAAEFNQSIDQSGWLVRWLDSGFCTASFTTVHDAGYTQSRDFFLTARTSFCVALHLQFPAILFVRLHFCCARFYISLGLELGFYGSPRLQTRGGVRVRGDFRHQNCVARGRWTGAL